MKERAFRQARVGFETARTYRILKRNGVSTREWNKGNARGFRDLVGEVVDGESVLVVENGELIRKVTEVHIDIRYRRTDGVELQLVEDRQEFADGRVRRRGHVGVREKAKRGERPAMAARRGIAEELGVTRGFLLGSLGVSEEERPSGYSYPGLKTKYITHELQTEFSDQAFNPDGYKEVQGDVTTHFVWKEVPKPEGV